MSDFIAIDIGDQNIMVAKWNSNAHNELGNDISFVYSDYKEKKIPARVSYQCDAFAIGDHCGPTAMKRLNGVALGLKTIVGSNELYPDLDQALRDEKIRPNVLFDGRKRAIVTLKSRKERRYDVEALMALLIEYTFYLALKTPSDTYESLSSIVQERKQSLSQIVLTVPSYYTASHVRGLQMALDCKNLGEAIFLRENVATVLDYGFFRNQRHAFDASSPTVLFVEVGDVATTLTLARFSRNTAELLASESLLVGGRDFTHALARKIARKITEEGPEMRLSEEQLERMAQQLLTKAEEAKRQLSLEDIDETSLEIEDPNAADNVRFVDVTETELLQACEELLASVRAFVTRFASDKQFDSVELCGGGLRMRQLRACVAAGLQAAGILELMRETVDDETVVRGAAIYGEFGLRRELVTASEQRVAMRYETSSGVVEHSLCVVGYGECVATRGFCVRCTERLRDEASEDHDWSAIYATVGGQKELRPTMVIGKVVESADAETNRVNESAVETNRVNESAAETNRVNKRAEQPRKPAVPSVSSHVPIYISPSSSPKLSPRLPSSSPLFDIQSIPEMSHLPPSSVPPRHEDPSLYQSRESRTSSVSSCQPERVFLDLRQSIYVRFKDSATGYFSIYDATNNDALWGYAYFQDGERDGNWVQYYNGDTQVVKQQGSYRLGQKDGVFTTYFDNSKEVFMTVPYTSGRRDGYTLIYQRGRQLLSAIFYDRGVEKKRIEYYANGYMKRISMITDKPRVFAMIEFQNDGNVLYIGEARRSHVNGNLNYAYHGKGSYFSLHKAQLTGDFDKGDLLLDGKKVSIRDCCYSLRIIDKKVCVVETPEGLLPPWRPLKVIKEDDASWIEYAGKRRLLTRTKIITVSGRHYKQKASFSILEYPLVALESNTSETKIFKYYPYISKEHSVAIDNVLLNSELPGVIPPLALSSRQEFVGEMTVKDKVYPNTGHLSSVCCNKQANTYST